jgi:signal transduction histidine kinase
MWKISEETLQNLPHINEILAISVGNFSHIADVEMMKDLIVGGSAKREVQNIQITLADERVIIYTSVPLPDGAVLMTYIDVTDQFKVEKALRERNDALEESHKIKTDFLAHMSFELRNPLTSIIGFSEMLENEYVGALNDKQKEYMSSILTASGHLFSLINDILDLTTLEAGGLNLEISEFDLADMMKESKARLDEDLEKKNLNLEITYPKDLKVRGDQKRLQHCFYNILANAVKFTQKDGNVTVSVELSDQDYIIKVKDNGLGIYPEELDRVYEKFYVGSNVPKGKGAGLGLSLARSFVELHGGVIHITSSLGEGTIVRYSLPITDGLS